MAKQDKSSSNLIWLLLLPALIGIFLLNNSFQNEQINKPVGRVSVKKNISKTIKAEPKKQKHEQPIKIATKPIPVQKTETKKEIKKAAPVNVKKVKTTPKPKPIPVVQKKKTTTTTENVTTVSLTINKGNSSMVYKVSSPSMKTVLDVLTVASTKYGFSLDCKTYSYGAFIEEIDGLKNDKNNAIYWLYYMNDKLATLGASSQKIKEGDKILWKYEKEK